MNKEQELLKICQQLKPLIGEKARALWLSFVSSETHHAKLEGEAMIRLVALKHLPGELGHDEPMFPPPPKKHHDEFHLGQALYGGHETDSEISLSRRDLTKHILITGTTGSGKSNVAFNLITQLLNSSTPFLVIDWKRAYRHLRIHSKEIQVFTIGRTGNENLSWNPLRGPPGVDQQTWIYIVASTLQFSHVGGDGVSDIWVQLFDEVFERRGFFDNTSSEYPNFFDAWNLLETKKFTGRSGLWADSTKRILRTFVYGSASDSFNARDPVKIEELLTKPVILEMDQALPASLRSFVADLFLKFIHLYRLSQGETSQLKHMLFLEEVHNLTPRGSIQTQSHSALESIFREIRSFGQGVVALTQTPSALPHHMLANANSLIFLALAHEDDLVAARKALFLEQREEKALGQLRTGEGLVRIQGKTPTCHVRFPLNPVLRDLEAKK